jgi:hypothetical protein
MGEIIAGAVFFAVIVILIMGKATSKPNRVSPYGG